MNLKELMTEDVQICRPEDSIARAAQVMQTANVGLVPVCQGDKLVGVITDRDIVLKAVAAEKNIQSTRVSDCMTTQVITANPEMDAHEAADLMAQHQIRRLPVIDKGGRLVGIVSLGDLATVSIHENEAGYALSEISEPSQPQTH